MRCYDYTDEQLDGADIAVTGMAARLPAAPNVTEFWKNLVAGRESIRQFSDEELRRAGVDEETLNDPDYVRAGAPLERLELFDADFFGFSPREARVLDPQHRHFLETCWEALEDAGLVPERFAGPIGVFGGSGMNAYMPYHLFTNPGLMREMGLFLVRHTGNDKDFLTTRVSYCLNLRGPSVNVQTACSTSLVAIHFACQSLLSGECDAALAGGVTIEMPHHRGYRYEEGEILSPDGRCRPFDSEAKGTVFGSGAGVVVLRRLADAVESGDYIHAVIKGSAINNDGQRKVGYLAPSVDGQAECIVEALAVAGLEARDISYVECHGTGTPLGDPIEVAALTQAFTRGGAAPSSCGLGSVKSNIGHLDTAAGVASFIKLARMLHDKQLVPTLHFQRPNPELRLDQTPFHVVDAARPWPAAPGRRRAGVSSLGVGGTNAHIILEEAPPRRPPKPRRAVQPLLVSARSPASLGSAANDLADYLETHPEIPLADVSATLLRRRRRFGHARVLAARNVEEACALLRSADGKLSFDVETSRGPTPTVFLFPGGGAQYANMSRAIYETEPVFREKLDECLDIVRAQEAVDVRATLFPAPGTENDATLELERRMTLQFPALVGIELAFAALLDSWGVRPAAMLGHSLGEYTAAHLAGVLSLPDTFRLVCCRARLMERTDPGGMLTVPLSPEAVQPWLGPRIALAAINGPELCVVSGATADLDLLAKQLAERDVDTRRLHISVGAHSHLLDPILPEFRCTAESIRYGAPEVPFFSNRTGRLHEQAPDAEYFVQHLRGTVQFSKCLDMLCADYPGAIFLELGPGQTLTSLGRQHPGRATTAPALSVSPHPKDPTPEGLHLVASVTRLAAHGGELDWAAFSGIEHPPAVPLPTTPFEHERHWIDPGDGFFMARSQSADGIRESELARWFYAPAFQETPRPRPNATPEELWCVFADPGPLTASLELELDARGIRSVFVSPGESPDSPTPFSVELSDPESYERVLSVIVAEHGAPHRFLHALCLSAPAGLGEDAQRERAFYSLLHLGQALSQEDLRQNTELLVATNAAVHTRGTAVKNPIQSLARGPVLVLPKELPDVQARLLDVDRTEDANQLARLLVDELASPCERNIITLRAGTRYSETIERIALSSPAEAASNASRFLFTGGLGGISLALAKGIARSTKARIALVSRSGLPASDVAEADARRQALGELAELGAEVVVLKGNVTDADSLTATLREATSRFGGLDVVVHAAGSMDDAPLALKTRESARAVLEPKVDGTRQLVHALETAPPTTLVLISSTSATLGPPGQIDYVAANAFLNAEASALAAELPNTRVLALGFGIWRDSGMAARAQTGPSEQSLAGEPTGHPLLGRKETRADGGVVFRAVYRPDTLWVLDEHRVRGGSALLPGTGFVEIARAAGALTLGADPDRPLEIRNVAFLTALEVPDGAGREIEIRVDTADAPGEHRISVASRGKGEAEFTEHMTAAVRRGSASRSPSLPVADIETRCNERQVSFETGRQSLPQDRELAFGARWKVIRKMGFGRQEALAHLQLPDEFAGDLSTWRLHPGMLDIASGFAFSLADVGGQNDQVRVPLGYESLRIFGGLPQAAVSFVRCKRNDASTGVALFDVRIADESGRVFVEIDGYMTKTIAPAGFRRVRQSEGPSLLDRWIERGITDAEGAEVFARLLASGASGCIYATPVSPYALAQELTPQRDQPEEAPASTLARSARFVDSPRDDVERQLASLWQNLLGVDRVGIRENFFDLGGHSLIAVRLFSRIKKIYGVDFSLAVLFDAPTIEGTAGLIRDALGLVFNPDRVDAAPSQPEAASSPSAAPKGFQPLVTIQRGNGAGQPFFCVHGAGGNVLNFRDLAKGIGKDQAFYGLQAPGVDGSEPSESIEAMADLYLRSIREVKPRGPYLLGGYSGGGVVAFEMAHRLRQAGEDVPLLVFLDTFEPRTKPRQISLRERFERLMQTGPSYLGARALAKLSRHRDELRTELKMRFYEKEGLPLPLELRDLKMARAFVAAAGRYTPARYDGRVILYRAKVIGDIYQHVGPRLGWDDIVPNLEIVEVPGDHDSLVLEPNVQVVTSHLKTALGEAIAQKSPT